RVVVTRNLPEPWEPRWSHPRASLHVIDSPRPQGFGANHNAAFKHCETEWFVIANPDLRLPTDPLPAMMEAATPEVGLIAPVVRESDGCIADSARPLPSPLALFKRYLPVLVPGARGRIRARPPRPGAPPPQW